MLLLELLMRALQGLQSPNLALEPSFRCPFLRRRRAREPPFAEFLPPPRQHERVNIQRFSDRLDLNPRSPTQEHRGALERHPVLTRLLRAGSGHRDTSCG